MQMCVVCQTSATRAACTRYYRRRAEPRALPLPSSSEVLRSLVCVRAKNDALTGKAAQRGEWLLELEPCVHNVFACLEHFLGVDFTPCRPTDGRPMPWEQAGEAHAADVSPAARTCWGFALRSLSRPGLELRGCVHPPRSRAAKADVFYVDLDVAVNGAPAWRWVLTRIHLAPCKHFAHLCAKGEDGKPGVFITSKHSHIEDHSKERWSWLAESQGGEQGPRPPGVQRLPSHDKALLEAAYGRTNRKE